MIRLIKYRLLLLCAAVAVVGCGPADFNGAANGAANGATDSNSAAGSNTATGSNAAPRIGQSAPAFSVMDTRGQIRDLSDFRGQLVVLEWTGRGCSYVNKHYDTGNLQMQQRKAREDYDAVWLTIISGPISPEAADEMIEQREAFPTTVLLDESGDMARAYDASVAPHLYIIDAEGVLRYMGGIDSRPGDDPAEVEGATQFVLQGLDRLASGHPVVKPITRPYGCSLNAH